MHGQNHIKFKISIFALITEWCVEVKEKEREACMRHVRTAYAILSGINWYECTTWEVQS